MISWYFWRWRVEKRLEVVNVPTIPTYVYGIRFVLDILIYFLYTYFFLFFFLDFFFKWLNGMDIYKSYNAFRKSMKALQFPKKSLQYTTLYSNTKSFLKVLKSDYLDS